MNECRTVTVDTADDSGGLKPGVNIPLIVDGEVIGAVGLTGEPAEVEEVAEVIALTVELLVKEERQRHTSRWHEDAVRQVIMAWQRGRDQSGLVEALRRVRSPLSTTVAVAVVGLEPA